MPTFDVSTNPERIPYIGVLTALCDIAQARGVQIMVVGATARDIALAADGYDAPLRATNDVDIAVAVANAGAFDRLVADLVPVPASGAHAFLVNGIDIDIVPFGGVEREDRTVAWPDGSRMNTLGFSESLESALELLLPGGRRTLVASIPAQTALKVFAWADRGKWTDRDAVDLRVLMHSYGCGARLDHVYADDRLAVLAEYDFDVRLAGAHWLGVDVRRDLGSQVARRCRDIVDGDQPQGRLPLAMRGNTTAEHALLVAFAAGLQREPPMGLVR